MIIYYPPKKKYILFVKGRIFQGLLLLFYVPADCLGKCKRVNIFFRNNSYGVSRYVYLYAGGFFFKEGFQVSIHPLQIHIP